MKRQKAFSPDLLRDIHAEPSLKPVTVEELEASAGSRELVPLTKHEEHRLVECEQIIIDGLNTFMEVGQALMEIRNRRLYRQEYKTFEAYAHQRWGIKRQRAYELMGASEVTRNLSEISDILPAKESHAASLLKLSPAEQRGIWQEIIEEAGDDVHKLTASQIKRKVQSRLKANADTLLAPEELQARAWQEEATKPLTKAIKKTPEALFISISGTWLIQNNLEHIWRELRGVSRKIDANFSDVITIGEAFELGIIRPGK
jgi:hypothetical protein